MVTFDVTLWCQNKGCGKVIGTIHDVVPGSATVNNVMKQHIEAEHPEEARG